MHDLHPHPVTSLDIPELRPFGTMRRPAEHREQGIFVAEGEKVVRRLLGSRLITHSLLLTPRWWEQIRPTIPSRESQITVYVADETLMRQIVGYNFHQGIMAVGRIPPEPSLQSLPSPHLLVALDGITLSENVGVIVRNCAGLGAHCVISGETSCSPYLRRAVRNSMGTVFSLPVLHPDNLADTLRHLAESKGTRMVAADPNSAVDVRDQDFRGNVCVVAGNEDTGVSKEVLKVCTSGVRIPMHAGTDSLNVASAAAVILYEAQRQRSAGRAYPPNSSA